jgi:hypothetical protein
MTRQGLVRGLGRVLVQELAGERQAHFSGRRRRAATADIRAKLLSPFSRSTARRRASRWGRLAEAQLRSTTTPKSPPA